MIKKTAVIIMLCPVVQVLLSCSTATGIRTSVSSFRNVRMAVADAVFMHEAFGITDDVERFNKNLFVGSIQFSGGFVRNPEMGMMVQSKQKTLSDTGRFEKNAKGFAEELMRTVLNERKSAFFHTSSPSVIKLISFSDETERKQYPEDQRDSINLPRQKRLPVDVDKKISALLSGELKTKYIAVPVIEYYYGHNGGWFNGQNMGTGAGTRFSFKLYIVDLENAAIVLDYEKTEVTLFDFDFDMSVIEMEQELYKSERKIINELNRVFPD